MPHPILAQAAADISYWPLGILAISVAFIFVSIIKLKLHPFLALIFAAILTGLLVGDLPGMTTENVGLFKSRVDLNATPTDTGNDMLLAVNWALLGFGNTAAGIGFVVALAAIIGVCMLGSGAADRVVRWLLSVFGEKRAGLVLLSSGFRVSAWLICPVSPGGAGFPGVGGSFVVGGSDAGWSSEGGADLLPGGGDLGGPAPGDVDA